MSRMWQNKKASLSAMADEFSQRSPMLELLGREDMGDEWRSMWLLKTATLVQRQDGTLHLAGPIVLGIRYHESFLGECPHPMEIVTVLQPRRLFHPNAAPTGALCLGHPQPGLSLEYIIHQAWAGLTFNMRKVNTQRGDILNPAAARFVRANAERFPLTQKGIYEEPDGPPPATPPLVFGSKPEN
jgi:hypothetical protein